jgi:hypothetical protein
MWAGADGPLAGVAPLLQQQAAVLVDGEDSSGGDQAVGLGRAFG